MLPEIEKLQKQVNRTAGPVAWPWKDLSKTLKKAGADPDALPEDLRSYLCEGLFEEPLNLTLTLYSRNELENSSLTMSSSRSH
jgi:hypothetical protein